MPESKKNKVFKDIENMKKRREILEDKLKEGDE